MLVTFRVQVYGLVACSESKRLYISDWDNDKLHAVPLSIDEEDEDPTSWAVASQPAGLSFTPHNILVACHGAGKVQEWNPEGILIRQIQLADEARLVWHALLMTEEEMLISHEGSQHQVSIIVIIYALGNKLLTPCGFRGLE